MVVVGMRYISEVAVLPAFQHAKTKGTNMKSTPTISAPRNPKAGLGSWLCQNAKSPECKVPSFNSWRAVVPLAGKPGSLSSPDYFMR
jgi:hypothetical protein